MTCTAEGLPKAGVSPGGQFVQANRRERVVPQSQAARIPAVSEAPARIARAQLLGRAEVHTDYFSWRPDASKAQHFWPSLPTSLLSGRPLEKPHDYKKIESTDKREKGLGAWLCSFTGI